MTNVPVRMVLWLFALLLANCNLRFDMADSISAISAVIGLIDVAARTSSQIVQLIAERRDAPKQLHFLSEEVSMSRQVAQQLKAFCNTLVIHRFDQVPECAKAIMIQLDRARPVWAELEEIVRSVRGLVNSKVHNERWVRKPTKVVSLQAKLRDPRFSTFEILGIYNAYVQCPMRSNSKTEPKIDLQSIRIGSAIATYHNTTVAMYEITANSLSEIMSKLKELEARPCTAKPLLRESAIHDFENESDSRATFRNESIKTARCKRRCFCRCHSIRRKSRIHVRTVKSIFGSLVVVYSGWKISGQHCNIASCLSADVSEVEAKYFLPRWSFDL